MESFAYDRYRFRIMTVERPTPTLLRVFAANGYVCCAVIAFFGETLFVHSSETAILERFQRFHAENFLRFGGDLCNATHAKW